MQLLCCPLTAMWKPSAQAVSYDVAVAFVVHLMSIDVSMCL
jgi:hypothetical protein